VTEDHRRTASWRSSPLRRGRSCHNICANAVLDTRRDRHLAASVSESPTQRIADQERDRTAGYFNEPEDANPDRPYAAAAGRVRFMSVVMAGLLVVRRVASTSEQ